MTLCLYNNKIRKEVIIMGFDHNDSEYFDEWTPGDMLEITFEHENDFLKIKESLTRIGVGSYKDNSLIQSCHILHKKGKYYLMQFKELFCLDGRDTDITWDDIARRNTIALLLQEWGMLKIVDMSKVEHRTNLSRIKIVPFKEKSKYNLISKYTIGTKYK